jgi:hypothetical protein
MYTEAALIVITLLLLAMLIASVFIYNAIKGLTNGYSYVLCRDVKVAFDIIPEKGDDVENVGIVEKVSYVWDSDNNRYIAKLIIQGD